MVNARLKYIVKSQKGKVPKTFSENTSLLPYLSMEFLRDKPDTIQYVEEEDNLKVVEENEVLVLWDGANAGEVILSKKGYLSSTMAVLKGNPDYFENGFLFYFLKSKEGELKKASTGTTIPHLDQDFLFSTHFLFPPKEEQDEIVQYIKEQEEKINQFIQKKKRFIELLKEQSQNIISQSLTKGLNAKVKMKTTSVEGLNQIPEHWQMRRLKNVSKTISKGTTPSTVGSETTAEGIIRFLRAENLYENKLSITPTFYIDEETDAILFRSRLEANDILVVIAGATLGRTGIVAEEVLPANTNQAVCFIRPENILPEFLLMWMQTSFINSQIWLNATKAAQPNLAMGKISAFNILYPPTEEQKQIVEHIKAETKTIETAITKAEREIELIREFKEAMIAEAVMGKRNTN